MLQRILLEFLDPLLVSLSQLTPPIRIGMLKRVVQNITVPAPLRGSEFESNRGRSQHGLLCP